MPKLISLYIKSVATGFAIAFAFTGLLVWFNIAGIGKLIMGSDIGWVAFLMVAMFHGIVFAGVQFAYVIMRMAEPADSGPRGGNPAPDVGQQLAPVMVKSGKVAGPQRP